LARLEPPAPLRFFTAAEEPTLVAFCDVVLAQDAEPRVPVAAMVDAKMADGKLDGYRYADMPRDPDTWRIVLAGLDHTAQAAYDARFADCRHEHQENVVREFAEGRLVGGPWEELNATRAWSVVMRAVLAEFYSHPWAWNEIGFGGPAYPRGFLRLGGGDAGREPFEKPGADPLARWYRHGRKRIPQLRIVFSETEAGAARALLARHLESNVLGDAFTEDSFVFEPVHHVELADPDLIARHLAAVLGDPFA